MVLELTGIAEAMEFARLEYMDGENILREWVSVAQDIADGKGEEYPFAVKIQAGRKGSASFRFAEADREKYPEKRGLLSVDGRGRLHYEGEPVLYGDDPVPLEEGARERAGVGGLFPGPARLRLVPGGQLKDFRRFASFAETAVEEGWFGSFVITREDGDAAGRKGME